MQKPFCLVSVVCLAMLSMMKLRTIAGDGGRVLTSDAVPGPTPVA